MKQFDLEQHIMNCWNVCEDLKILAEAVIEKSPSTDTISNILVGMQELYQLKFEKCFEVFEEYAKENYENRKKIPPL